jgi:glycosyltransferase involved in cell wall biosynthesis
MKIALFHNYYKHPSGEDTMFKLEMAALREQGHTVVSYTADNAESFAHNSLRQKISGALHAPHRRSSQLAIAKFLAKERPDISHIHNWYPILSPSIYTAHQDAGIPVVQSLHNYRLSCAAATHYRNGQSCNACRPGHNLAAIRHRCYKNSIGGSIAWKRIMDRGWKQGIFSSAVNHYISPSQEVRSKHIQMGIAPHKISYIPNACPDPHDIPPNHGQLLNRLQQNICFVGRLVPEKGADILIRAWQDITHTDRSKQQLTLIGTGPQEGLLRELARGDESIQFTGQLSIHDTLSILKQADLLVCPSIWAEPFGLSVIEAMGAGIPVISSKLGGPAEIIADGIDGYLLPPGDIAALRHTLSHCLNTPEKLKARGRAARLKYLRHYTPQRHAQRLTSCFQQVLTPPAEKAATAPAAVGLPAAAVAGAPVS